MSTGQAFHVALRCVSRPAGLRLDKVEATCTLILPTMDGLTDSRLDEDAFGEAKTSNIVKAFDAFRKDHSRPYNQCRAY